MTPRVYGQLRKSSSPPTDKEAVLGKFAPVAIKPLKRREPPSDYMGTEEEWDAVQDVVDGLSRDNPDYQTTAGLIAHTAIETFLLSEPLLNTARVFTTQMGGWLWLLWWDGEEMLFVAENLVSPETEVRDPSLQTLLARIEPMMVPWKIRGPHRSV